MLANTKLIARNISIRSIDLVASKKINNKNLAFLEQNLHDVE